MTSTERVRAFRERNRTPSVIRHCPVCHTVIMGRGKTCSPRCRKALSRSKQRQAEERQWQANQELAIRHRQSWESLDRDMLWQAVKDNPIRDTSMTPDGFVVDSAYVDETAPNNRPGESIHITVYSPDYNPNHDKAWKVYRVAGWTEGVGWQTLEEGDCETMVTAIQSVWADPEGCYNRWRDRLIELGGDKVHWGVVIPPTWELRQDGHRDRMFLGESDDEYIERMAREEEQSRRDSLISDAENETSEIMNELFGYSWHLK